MMRRRSSHSASASPATRRSPAAHRGFTLVEMVAAIALMAIVSGLATQLMVRLLATGRDLSVDERSTLVIDRATADLRRDAERAAAVSFDGGVLKLGPVTWTTEADALVRTDGMHVDRFAPLGQSPSFALRDDIVTLRLADETWAFAPLVDREGVR